MKEELTKFIGASPQIKIEEKREILRRTREEEQYYKQYDSTAFVNCN